MLGGNSVLAEEVLVQSRVHVNETAAGGASRDENGDWRLAGFCKIGIGSGGGRGDENKNPRTGAR
jgi:hypothetical protein